MKSNWNRLAAAAAGLALALASCNSVFKAAKSGEGDPEAALGNPHRPADVRESQQETLEKVQDQSLRR